MDANRTKEHSDAGAKIAGRRGYLKLSRPKVASLSDGVLYVELQKRIEDGDKKVRTLLVNQIAAYMKALKWSKEDFERETGVELPDSGGAVPGSAPSPPRLLPKLRGLTNPILCDRIRAAGE